MPHSRTTVGRWAAILAVLALLAGSVGAASTEAPAAGPAGPIIEPGSWSDSLDDTQGLSWLQGTRHGSGQVSLSELETLGDNMGEVWSLAEGADARFYMGAGNAHLWSYDPATGESLDLGAPVPDECDT